MAVKPGDPIWVPPSASARIGGETLPPLILNAIGTRYFIDARLDGSIQDGNIDSTTKGAPTLTLSVIDPDGELLNSSLLTRRIDLVLDNVPFRLVQVSRQEDDLLSLEFEHRLCSWLREHETPRKASRGTKTRAEFAYSLVLEVKKEHVIFISPDLHKRQARAVNIDRKTKDERRISGFAHGKSIKGRSSADFTPSQLRNADRVMSAAQGLNASAKATKALVEACIVEGPDFNNPFGGEGTSSGILQLTGAKGSPGSKYHVNGSTSTKGGRRDIELVASAFLSYGFWSDPQMGSGGAMDKAKRFPAASPGRVAQATQGSAYPARYDQVAAVAQRVIDAWRGSSANPGTDSEGFAKFEFTRGAVHKGDAPEDSWMALQRLADEVRWRCFIDGRNVLYFVSDEQLMRSRPLYLVSPHTQGVRSVTFDMEVGRRTVVYKGRRQHKPSEAILKVRMGRWAAPPGAIVELADYGLADGRWIVDSMNRGIFDAEAEVHLRQPQKALPEPAAARTAGGGTTRSTSGGAAGGRRGKGEQLSNTFRGSPVPGQRPGPSTHETAGLPGYPARDYFGKPGTPCVAPENGKIRKLSGRDPSLGGSAGGPMGYSIYVAADSGNDYFLTHLDNVLVKVGQRVDHGEQIAEIAHSGAGSWDNSSTHVHCGVHRGSRISGAGARAALG